MRHKEENLYTLEETLLIHYYTVFGFRNLWIRDIHQLSKFMGRTLGSINKQKKNVEWLLTGKGLTDYSKLQFEVYETFKGGSYLDLYNYVDEIIGNTKYMRDLKLSIQRKDPDKCTLQTSVHIMR